MEKLADLLAAIEREVSGISRSDNIMFDTEEEALAYATRLSNLKVGDVVLTKAVEQDAKRGVYFGTVDEGKRALILYYGKDREISGKTVPWGSIRFLE